LQRFRKNYFETRIAALHNDISRLETIQNTVSLLPMDKPTDKRPTLKSLAEITGLGISTVSQALRNSPEISEDTRKRVQLAATQAGYRPNRAGVRLRTGKTNVITVVLNPQDEGSGFFSDFVFGISEGLSGTPYHLVVTPYSLEDPMVPIRYILETSSADGVILSRTQPHDARLRFLHEHGVPFATHGRSNMGLEHPYFDYDNESFAYEALRKLKQRDRNRVALLGPPRELTYNIHTNLGFERGLRDFALTGLPLGSVDAEMPLEVTRQLGRDLALQRDKPDGFVVSNTTASVALSSGMADAGLVLGRDFDVVTKHVTPLVGMMCPGIITIPEDFREAGRRLAQLLIAAIDGAAPETLQELESIQV
jgi:LacI family transcriptional regulator